MVRTDQRPARPDRPCGQVELDRVESFGRYGDEPFLIPFAVDGQQPGVPVQIRCGDTGDLGPAEPFLYAQEHTDGEPFITLLEQPADSGDVHVPWVDPAPFRTADGECRVGLQEPVADAPAGERLQDGESRVEGVVTACLGEQPPFGVVSGETGNSRTWAEVCGEVVERPPDCFGGGALELAELLAFGHVPRDSVLDSA
jgi:hypothetical protein